MSLSKLASYLLHFVGVQLPGLLALVLALEYAS